MGAAQTVFLTGATQLLVEPPWLPAVLWDRVTLTCRGSGTDGATSWYKGRQRLWQEGRDSFTVTESGTYRCERPGSGFSPPVRVLNDSLVLQVPAGPLLEGDTVTLRCRGWQDSPLNSVSFYRDGKKLVTLHNVTELSLPPLQLQHRGNFSCEGRFGFFPLLRSAAVPVAVQAEHPAAATPTPPQPLPSDSGSQIPLPISFPELFSVPLLEGPPELAEGSPLNLSCLSTPSPLRPPAPLLYRFYRDGQLVGGPQGSPQLLVPAVGVSHSGNYSCEVRSEGGNVRKSSARLGVTVRVPVDTGHHWITVAAGVVGSLLFLVLLIVALYWWIHMGARKHQERAPPVQDPQATYMELRGPHGQPWEPSDIYDNLQQK